MNLKIFSHLSKKFKKIFKYKKLVKHSNCVLLANPKPSPTILSVLDPIIKNYGSPLGLGGSTGPG